MFYVIAIEDLSKVNWSTENTGSYYTYSSQENARDHRSVGV